MTPGAHAHVSRFQFQQLIGISFHVGSGCQDAPIYAEAIGTARKLFDFAESIGYKFRLLDIGGGFPGDKNTDIGSVKMVFCIFNLKSKI